MASNTQANGTNRLLHFLDLDEFGLEEVPEEQRPIVKREVAEFLKDEVLRKISSGDSPVAGIGRFKILTPEYAKREKGGRRISDLELEGDLKDSLISTPSTGAFIKFGHEGEQVPKADGNNQLSGKAKTWARKVKHPKRQYIPDDGQQFDKPIVNGIKRIIEDFKQTAADRERVEEFEDEDFFVGVTAEDERPVTTDSNESTQGFFSDDVIEDLLEDAFRRRGIF